VLAPRQSRRVAQRKTNGTGIVGLSASAVRFSRAQLSLRLAFPARRPDATHGDTSGMLPTWTTRAPFDRRVGNPNVANGTVAPWSFLS
jgi:hypothetical protein